MDHKIRRPECDTLFFEHLLTHDMQVGSFASHTHSAYELLYVVSGEVTLTVEDKKYKLKKDDLAVVRPLCYHFTHIDAVSDYERYNFLFNPGAIGVDNIDLLPEGIDVYNCRHRQMIGDLIKKTDYYSQHLCAEALLDISACLLKELVYNLSIISKEEWEASSLTVSHPLISEALKIINAELFSKISIPSVARRLFVTESYFYRLFKEELGITPARYISEKRLHTARSMISLGASPTRVHSECGFCDYTSFYRSYVRYFGYPPSKEKQVKVVEG